MPQTSNQGFILHLALVLFDPPRLVILLHPKYVCCSPAAFETPFCRFPRQAKNSGKFSSEELQNLKREFQHHKDKTHEYNILMDTVSRTEGELHESFPLLFYRAEVYFLRPSLSAFKPCPFKVNKCKEIHHPTLFSAYLAVPNSAVA